MRIGTHQTINLEGGETILRVTERCVNEVSRPDSAKVKAVWYRLVAVSEPQIR